MTFDEWVKHKGFGKPRNRQDSMMFEVMERTYKAAQKIEREACAKVCEDTGAYSDEIEMAQMCAQAIRSRGQTND